jgi:hypothetical protein
MPLGERHHGVVQMRRIRIVAHGATRITVPWRNVGRLSGGNEVLNEKRRIAMLAAVLFTASLAGGVILGLFGDALSDALGTVAAFAVEYVLPPLATLAICLGFAMRWPGAALRRSVVAYLIVQLVGLALGGAVWWLLLPEFVFPTTLVVMDLVSGLVCAGIGAMVGMRLAR